MGSKKDVYVNVDTEKKGQKLIKLLDMFGENIGIWVVSFGTDKKYNSNYIGFCRVCGGWVCSRHTCSNLMSGKKEVTIKELRNILAAEHLKKGDYFIGEIFGYRRVVKFDSFSNGYFIGTYQYPKGEVVSGETAFHNFIRFATDEEIQSFESNSKEKELTPDDYKDKTWYKRKSGALIFIDKSVDSNLGITSIGYCSYRFPWFKSFQSNKFNVPGEWTEASYEEVADITNNLNK